MSELKRYRLRTENLSWRKVADEIVILDLDSSAYLTLNVTGAALWERLSNGGATADELVAALRESFEVDEEQARRDVEAFVLTCEKENLVETEL